MSAMQAGADMCINSTHKMLGSLSQTAMLHVQGHAHPARPSQSGVQTLSSRRRRIWCWSRRSTSRGGRWRSTAPRCSRARSRSRTTRAAGFNDMPDVYCFGEELEGRPGVFDLDPTKVTITVKELGYTGYEAEEILRRRYNVQVELADLFNCLALFTIGTTPEAADELVLRRARARARRSAARHLLAVRRARTAGQNRHVQAADRSRRSGSFRAKRFSPTTEFVPFKSAPAASAPR